MKYILVLSVILLGLSSCLRNQTEESKKERVKLVTSYNKKSSFLYEIIEIDGVEYVATSRGGICPLVKDTTSKKIVFKVNN